MQGKYHHARFELVYRYFSTHKIHEMVFNYVGQHEVRFPWVRANGSINHDVVREVVHGRAASPEFRIKNCNQKGCRDIRTGVLERMKRADEARARTAAFNAELSRSRVPNAFPGTRSPKKAFVYAIQTGNYVKIGIASDVTKRVVALQTSSPTALTVINAWRHYDAERIERSLHRKFKEYRASGEWFQLPSAQIESLKRADRVEQIVFDDQGKRQRACPTAKVEIFRQNGHHSELDGSL